jgi:hypothetical protein
VDRQKSIEALKHFLHKKDALLERERQWLLDVHAEGVLSDAAFLGWSVIFFKKSTWMPKPFEF